MACMKLGLIFLFLHSCSSFGIDEIETIISATEGAVSTLVKATELAEVANKHADSEVKIPFSKNQRLIGGVFKKFTEVTRLINNMYSQLQANNIQTISSLQHSLPVAFRFELRLDTIEDTITMVDLYYGNFLAYSQLSQGAINAENDESNEINVNVQTPTPTQKPNNSANFNFERYTLENFAMSLTSHEPTSVKGLLERLNEFIVPSSKDSVRLFMRDGIFNTILTSFDEIKSSMCNIEMSPQQLIFNLYNTLQMTQLKGFVMMQFAWTLLHSYGKGNFTTETQLLTNEMKARATQQMATVMKAMQKADNEVYKCDPKVQIEGRTYVQLTKLLQGYIANEVDLNPKQSCTDNCAAYPHTKMYGCFDNQFCARQTVCDGNIVNCKYHDSDMTLCPTSPHSNSSRRYEWIQYENGLVLGKKKRCNQFEDKVDSWWRFVYHCSYCMCLCDARKSLTSDRYFSLRPVESDIMNNKIVVGLRFVKENRVIHFQIRQATLLPKLEVDAATAEWVDVNSFKVTDFKIVEGLDYLRLTFEKRGMDLDDLRLPDRHVLTGVRLRVVGTHLNLEVRSTPFDFKTGQLSPTKSTWFGNDNTDASMDTPRFFLDLESRDVPTLSQTPSIMYSTPDSYILFTNSDFEKDAAQTSLPFIDTQAVTTDPVTPLSGAGIYHKGTPGYGGYVAPKIFTYDASQFLSSEFLSKNTK